MSEEASVNVGPIRQEQIDQMRAGLETKTKEELISIIIASRVGATELSDNTITPILKAEMLRIAKEIELENHRIKPVSEAKELTIEDVMARANVLIGYINNT